MTQKPPNCLKCYSQEKADTKDQLNIEWSSRTLDDGIYEKSTQQVKSISIRIQSIIIISDDFGILETIHSFHWGVDGTDS